MRLTIFAEASGRINYGPRLGEHKGLLGPVLVDRRMVQWWEVHPVDLEDGTALAGTAAAATAPFAPCLASAAITLTEPADAHLALPGFGRGFVWVNGFLLGRYAAAGPQRTLYIPAPLLHTGTNEFLVLEFERLGGELTLGARADLGPEEEFIEEF